MNMKFKTDFAQLKFIAFLSKISRFIRNAISSLYTTQKVTDILIYFS